MKPPRALLPAKVGAISSHLVYSAICCCSSHSRNNPVVEEERAFSDAGHPPATHTRVPSEHIRPPSQGWSKPRLIA
jgi:hypothetical protein